MPLTYNEQIAEDSYSFNLSITTTRKLTYERPAASGGLLVKAKVHHDYVFFASRP
jgi:hypothetical protein